MIRFPKSKKFDKETTEEMFLELKNMRFQNQRAH